MSEPLIALYVRCGKEQRAHIEYGQRRLLRWEGRLLYDGPAADMPAELKQLASQCRTHAP